MRIINRHEGEITEFLNERFGFDNVHVACDVFDRAVNEFTENHEIYNNEDSAKHGKRWAVEIIRRHEGGLTALSDGRLAGIVAACDILKRAACELNECYESHIKKLFTEICLKTAIPYQKTFNICKQRYTKLKAAYEKIRWGPDTCSDVFAITFNYMEQLTDEKERLLILYNFIDRLEPEIILNILIFWDDQPLDLYTRLIRHHIQILKLLADE